MSSGAGLVLRIVAGRYRVQLGNECQDCVLGGRLKQGEETAVVVGDRVEIERLPEGPCRIVDVLPRRSELARRSVTRRREQVIAANLDQVTPVMAVARPDPDVRMLDRLLVLAELNELDAFVVLNKADLATDGLEENDLPPLFHPYRDAGYDVLYASVKRSWGLDELGERMADRTTVLAGPSGAGKSSLLNALLPGSDLRVGEVGEREGRGRHTTVNASLHPLPGGGYVADTPGLQYLALWDTPPELLSHAFPEFRPWLPECRFNDCRHLSEPDCGVKEALEKGDITESRYDSYRALLEEAEEAAQQW